MRLEYEGIKLKRDWQKIDLAGKDSGQDGNRKITEMMAVEVKKRVGISKESNLISSTGEDEGNSVSIVNQTPSKKRR
jgi:hypothetical protein